MIALPEWMTTVIGAALAALIIAIILIRRKTAVEPITGEQTEIEKRQL